MRRISSFLLVAIGIFSSCHSYEDRTTNTFSTSFKSDAEKIAFMEKYYAVDFPYEDVEYHIVYYDNGAGRGAPGPSDWTMFFAFKLSDEETQKRVTSNISSTVDTEPWEQFLPQTKKWKINYPKIALGDDILVEDNNILLVRFSTM